MISLKNHSEFSDDELFKMLGGTKGSFAFEEIYERYWDKLFGAAYKRVKCVETAEEIVQDLFTKIWIRRTELSINVPLAVYLYTAIKYRVANHFHHEYVKLNYTESFKTTAFEADNSTEDMVILSDLTKQLKAQVELLPVKCREVFELSRNENKSNKEIAACMGISEKTVENHMSKALRRLRLSLDSVLFLL